MSRFGLSLCRDLDTVPAKIAIIGRPNVGKSTLFNRLVGKRLALVDDTPGVTRDRRAGDAKLGDLRFTILDTAGLEEADARTLEGRMRAQTEEAIAAADAVLFVIDARAGLTPSDSHFANMLRRTSTPVVLIANKAEGRSGEGGLYEAFSLGFGDPIAMSAEHGEGLADLYRVLLPIVDAADAADEAAASEKEAIAAGEIAVTDVDVVTEDEDEEPVDTGPAAGSSTRPLRVAVVGRPNAGKSTLLNAILGDDRFLTGPEAGITRDSITVAWQWRDREIRLVDTAGLRKRQRVQEKLERMSTSETIHALQFCDVVVLVMDPNDAFEKQDVQIAGLALREGRGLVFAITKWDAIDQKSEARNVIESLAERRIPQAKGAPIEFVSGKNGKNLDRLMDACLSVHRHWSARVKTRDLNDWLHYVVQKHPPPAPDGKRVKPRYMAQIKTRPPTFVLMASRAESMPETYKRYLLNELREAFDLPGVPIRLEVKQGKNPYADKG